MNLSPLSSPMRRLPKPPAPLSRAHGEDENSLPAPDRGALKYPATLSPSRALPSNNRSSFLLPNPTNEKSSHSVSPKSRKGDKPKRLSYQEPTSHSTQQGDVQSEARHSQEWNSYMEQFQCEVGDCYRKRLPGITYCKSHVCRADSCANVRALGARYCVTHKCRSCNARSGVASGYCEAHKCRVPSCTLRKEEGRDRCKQHVCGWRGCTEDPMRGAWYCRDHVCAAGDCGLKVLSIDNRVGNYCCCHTCLAEGCLLKASRGAFCVEHECLVPGCPNPRLWDDEYGLKRAHICCRYHTCVQRGCFAPTPQIGTLCTRHFEATS